MDEATDSQTDSGESRKSKVQEQGFSQSWEHLQWFDCRLSYLTGHTTGSLGRLQDCRLRCESQF